MYQTKLNMQSPPNKFNEVAVTNIYLRSINLAQYIAELDHYNMDKIPKLVGRHTKTIDTMEQLFPTCYGPERVNKPDYRFISCFNHDPTSTS
ncbi:unnamed protein product [Rotaria sp. Silwood1]|nr:unnamed protein product [Rotaria sp. Silwood1]CAF1180960.1 unnamed protein product [Rotaria sp. Silwood1]CAF3435838.1 unnamed protein product [Rotaria sp. Silwood1]CAF3456804.1 unnamed protein product [Rotaria sp. Silwood1]CAF3480452.1 unnamed protein product [Rotaria sp. Silwood1]